MHYEKKGHVRNPWNRQIWVGHCPVSGLVLSSYCKNVRKNIINLLCIGLTLKARGAETTDSLKNEVKAMSFRPPLYTYSGDPLSDRLTKRTIPEYGPPFFSPKYFPIHIMYYQIHKADWPAIRDTDHLFSVPNHKRTRKTVQQKKIIHTFTVIYASIKGPAAAGFTNGTSCSWIHQRDQHWHNLLSSLAVVGSNKGTRSGWIQQWTSVGWIH